MRARNLLLIVCLLAAVPFMVIGIQSNADHLRNLSAVDVAKVCASLLAMILATLGLAALWVGILNLLRAPVRRWAAVQFFIASWPFRYIPGTLPYHAARVLAGETVGASKSAIVTSIAYESILMISAAAFVGICGLAMGLALSASSNGVYILAGLPLVILLFGLQPRILVPVANKLLSIAKRQPISAANFLSSRETIALFLGYVGVNCLTGLSFWLVCSALTGTTLNPILAVGAFSLAGAAGVAVIFVPSGIGVREAVVVTLLSSVIAPQDAILAAGVTRGLSIIADLMLLAALGFIHTASHLRLRNGPSRAPNPSHRIS